MRRNAAQALLLMPVVESCGQRNCQLAGLAGLLTTLLLCTGLQCNTQLMARITALASAGTL